MSCSENGDKFPGILDSFIIGTFQKLGPAFMRLRDGRTKVTTEQQQNGVAMPCFQIQLFVQNLSRSSCFADRQNHHGDADGQRPDGFDREE
jgi:hypothetical protein